MRKEEQFYAQHLDETSLTPLTPTAYEQRSAPPAAAATLILTRLSRTDHVPTGRDRDLALAAAKLVTGEDGRPMAILPPRAERLRVALLAEGGAPQADGEGVRPKRARRRPA